MNNLVISVIMPVYNSEKYLKYTIESILCQSFKHFEFIIIDDGSTDNSFQIIRKYAERDNSRIIIINKGKQGLVSALNDGLTLAKGRYIARTDSDDISLPDRFKLQLGYMRKNPGCAILGSDVLLIDEDGDPVARNIHPTNHDEILEGLLKGRGEYIRHSTTFFRKDYINRIGGYREETEWAEDLDLYLRLSEIGRLSNLKEVLLKYRVHRESVNYKKWKQQRNAVAIVLRDYSLRNGLSNILQETDIVHPHYKLENWHLSWSIKALISGYKSTSLKHLNKSFRINPFRIKLFVGYLLFFLGSRISSKIYTAFKKYRMNKS